LHQIGKAKDHLIKPCIEWRGLGDEKLAFLDIGFEDVSLQNIEHASKGQRAEREELQLLSPSANGHVTASISIAAASSAAAAHHHQPIESTMTSVARLSIVGLAVDGGDIIVCIYIYKEPAMRRRIICVS